MVRITIDFLESHDDKSILEELKRTASISGKDTVTKERGIALKNKYILIY